MAGNSFGTIFRFTTWGESHGPAIGGVADGVPSLVPLCEADLQPYLDRRAPGQSRFTTQRREADQVRILSGIFEGRTTGAPIAFQIENTDARSKDYSDIAEKFRPGHADYTYWAKYGIRDYRGGGRSSARETAVRVAAGAIARRIIPDIAITGAVVRIGSHEAAADADLWDRETIAANPFFAADPAIVPVWEAYLDSVRKGGSSAGAVVEVRARHVPAGLGEPLYGKLDGDLAAAMMSINAVKGVEIGDGFAASLLSGEENADEMFMQDGVPSFASNHAGGILGGISTGQEIVVRLAVKPTSSILTPRRTVDIHGNETTISTTGRHDPCVGIRAVPVAEAMMAAVLADHTLRARAGRISL